MVIDLQKKLTRIALFGQALPDLGCWKKWTISMRGIFPQELTVTTGLLVCLRINTKNIERIFLFFYTYNFCSSSPILPPKSRFRCPLEMCNTRCRGPTRISALSQDMTRNSDVVLAWLDGRVWEETISRDKLKGAIIRVVWKLWFFPSVSARTLTRKSEIS